MFKSLLDFMAFVEKHPVTGTAILALIISGIIGIARIIGKRFSEKRNHPYAKPVNYGSRASFYVTSVQEYVSDDNPSGYRQVSHPRPDQWRTVIGINTTLFGLRHRVFPLNKDAILAVMVRKRRKEKIILFNRHI